jgi:hypothetical protein
VILASRPPISLPTTSVPSGLLDELISELGCLSAVYHKPVQAFVAGGKLGADQISSSQNNMVKSNETSKEAALATVIAGQKAENVSLESLFVLGNVDTE